MFQTSMFGNVVRSLCRDRRGLTLVAGAIGVLAGVEYLFSARAPKPVPVEPAPVTIIPPEPEPSIKRPARLKITQTRSELGYVYWVLQECCGKPSYALFDTWQEAMEEAARRIAAAEPVLVPA